MRKLICAIIILCLLICTPTGSALAQDNVYARAIVKDAYFCTKKDLNSALFTIPYTYCVRILEEDGDWYKVRYAEDKGIYRALEGYCKRDKLKVLDYIPEVTYLIKPITVKYTADEPSSLPVLGTIEFVAAYYGAYHQGASTYSYVLCQGSFGYILGANDDYELNEEMEVIPTPPKKDDENNENTRIITICVIGGLVALSLIIMISLSKKERVDES